MKLNNIKTYIGAAALALSMSCVSTSCINDLDVENINPAQQSTLDKDALFNKIYSSFVLTGQTGPNGNGDIQDADEGRSEFFRMAWNLNELTTDEAHWVWYKNDAGYEDLVENTYGADNAVSTGLYYRIYFTITLCNYYLDEMPEDGTEETAARRAEVRFIRAYNYYTVMDLYGNAAFTEHVGEKGAYYTRDKFFTYVENELTELEKDLKDPGKNTYGRIDKAAAWMMLSRLYLNSQVYTGKAQWEKAKEYAEKVLNNGYYKLFENSKTDEVTGKKYAAINPTTNERYTAYQMLFLADNDQSGARKEILLPVLHDGVNTQSYGGMHALILSTYSPEMSEYVPSGTSNAWGKCCRVQGKLCDIFFGGTDVSGFKTVAAVTDAANDDRALIFPGSYSKNIENEDDQNAGYACMKFRNVRSDGKPTSTNNQFVDTDFPLIRMAEAYLNYAEADAHLNNGVTTAKGTEMIKKLQDRANVPEIHQSEKYSLADIRDQWAKEYWFEGRRRMDLVRLNSFGGNNKYYWEWKGNAATGQKFSETRNIFGIPSTDLTNNTNLKQNDGY